MYTPPVTPREFTTPEVGEVTVQRSEGRSQESDKEERGKARFDLSGLGLPISDFWMEPAAEGGVDDWGEVVTR